MIKCSACGKEIIVGGKVMGSDGDFVCDDQCHDAFHAEMDYLYGGRNNPPATDEQFVAWLGVDKEFLGED